MGRKAGEVGRVGDVALLALFWLSMDTPAFDLRRAKPLPWSSSTPALTVSPSGFLADASVDPCGRPQAVASSVAQRRLALDNKHAAEQDDSPLPSSLAAASRFRLMRRLFAARVSESLPARGRPLPIERARRAEAISERRRQAVHMYILLHLSPVSPPSSFVCNLRLLPSSLPLYQP